MLQSWASPEPLIGWRIWRVRGRGLQSLRVDYIWDTGANQAECLQAPLTACTESPGQLCSCGFWALKTPSACAAMAGRLARLNPLVMGLVVGWGQVAVHGHEGFRSERARLLCLFEDVIGKPFAPSQSWIGRLRSRLRGIPPARRLEHRPPDREMLSELAAGYGVPLLALADSARTGVLAEFGVEREVIDEAGRWDYAATRDCRL